MHMRERDLRKLIDSLNIDAVIVKAAHYKIGMSGPLGKTTVFCPCTPSDVRTLKNLKAELRRGARLVGQHA